MGMANLKGGYHIQHLLDLFTRTLPCSPLGSWENIALPFTAVLSGFRLHLLSSPPALQRLTDGNADLFLVTWPVALLVGSRETKL